MPKNVQLASVSWESADGWLASGGETGLLKVLRLDGVWERAAAAAAAKSGAGNAQSAAISNNMKLNQTLDGHTRGWPGCATSPLPLDTTRHCC